jgi:hypothetical protein
MMASLTVASMRARLGTLSIEIADAERALDRADDSGGDHEATRCRRELEKLDEERREIEAALLEADPL